MRIGTMLPSCPERSGRPVLQPTDAQDGLQQVGLSISGDPKGLILGSLTFSALAFGRWDVLG